MTTNEQTDEDWRSAYMQRAIVERTARIERCTKKISALMGYEAYQAPANSTTSRAYEHSYIRFTRRHHCHYSVGSGRWQTCCEMVAYSIKVSVRVTMMVP